jgi:hypothetical protein
MYKRAYFIGVGAYFVMLALSVLFYKERIIFLDTAFGLFHIAKDSWFCIEIFRFADGLSQLLPVLAAKAGLSLNIMTVSYSVSFVLFYFICYLVTGNILKRYDFALVILVCNILFVSDTFYWTPSEVPQGIAVLLLLLAWSFKKQLAEVRPLMWVVLFLSMLTLAFFHPLLVFIIIYSVIYFAWNKVGFADRRLLYILLAFYVFSVLLKAIAFKTQYETHSLSGMKNFITQFPDYFTLFSNRRFLSNCLTKYYWIPLTFFAVCSLYAKNKEWKKLVFFSSVVIGYLFLVNISYPFRTTPEFYIENLYLPLAVFLGLPLVFELLPLLAEKRLALPVVCLLVATGCLRIWFTHTPYTARLNWERAFLDKYINEKIIADAKKINAGILLMNWGTPYEFWLLSTLERNKTASIIIDDDPRSRLWALDLNKTFVVNWNIFPYKDLNPKYFHFTDTTTGYLVDPAP